MSEVKSLVGILKSKMALEQCDPDVMLYFTDYYWIPVDQIGELVKAIIEAGYVKLADMDYRCLPTKETYCYDNGWRKVEI